MNHLIYIGCLLSGLLAHTSVNAELTEASALERGLTQPQIQILLKAQLEQARGMRDSAGRWNNPEIEYSQESFNLGTGRSEETTWWLKQRLNIAGSKGLERDAAALALQAAEARVHLERRHWQTRIREQFYATMTAQSRAEVLSEHHLRLQRIATVIEQRVAQGDASRYDSLRITQELARAQSLSAEAHAEQQAERQRLFSLVGGADEALAGEILPPAVQLSEQNVALMLEQHPQLQMLAALKGSASLNAKAARREAWPEVTIGVGRKTMDDAGYTVEGNAIAVGVEIPLFDRNHGEAQHAHGLANEYASDYALTRNRLHTQLQVLQTTLAVQREAAQALRQAATTSDGSLSTIAEASYQAGELSIMELLDAYRTELDTRQQYLSSARAARATFIQLQQLEGQ